MPYPTKNTFQPHNDNTFNVNSLNAPIKRPNKKETISDKLTSGQSYQGSKDISKMIKGSINQEAITILNVYELNYRILKYVKQKLVDLTRKIDIPIIILRDLNSSLSVINRTSRQKNRKNIENINTTNSQLELVDIYRALIQ